MTGASRDHATGQGKGTYRDPLVIAGQHGPILVPSDGRAVIPVYSTSTYCVEIAVAIGLLRSGSLGVQMLWPHAFTDISDYRRACAEVKRICAAAARGGEKFEIECNEELTSHQCVNLVRHYKPI